MFPLPFNIKKEFAWITLLVVTLTLGIYVRCYPLYSHLWSDASEKASILVITKIKASIRQQLLAEQPQLPEIIINKIVEEKFKEILKNESSRVKTTIEEVTRHIREDSGTSEKHYLLASDSYYYLELTENILRTGTLGDTTKASKYFHPLMQAPFGHWEPLTGHPYIGAFVVKIVRLFKPDCDVMFAVSFTPFLLISFVLLAFIITCRIFECGLLATLTGAVYFLLAPIVVKRSTFGWFDNDAYNLFFPLCALSCMGLIFHSIPNHRRVLWGGACFIILFSLYSLFWQGWGFAFGLVLLSMGTIIAVQYIFFKDKSAKKNSVLLIFYTLFGSLLAISLMFGLSDFFVLFKEGFLELQKFSSKKMSLWPSLFLGVSELKKTTLSDFLELTGGVYFLIISAIGMFGTLWKMIKKPSQSNLKFIPLVIYFLGTMFITLNAQRFILLAMVGLGLFFTLGIQWLWDAYQEWKKKFSSKQTRVSLTALGYLAILTTIAVPSFQGKAIAKSQLNPIFNPVWEKALLKIKNETPPESIVNTWWSPGHFIKAIAQRRVTFDGATLSLSPQAYWISNVFLSSDEYEAAGILRMLNTSGNKAVDYLTSLGLKTSQATDIIHHILYYPKKKAEQELQRILSPEQSKALLALTHAKAPPTYLFVYNEIMEKNLALAFYGNWDFKKVEELNANPDAVRSIPSKNSPDYVDFLWSLTRNRGPFKVSETLNALTKMGSRIIFEQNVVVDLTTTSCVIQSPKFGTGVPTSIVYLDQNTVQEKLLSNPTLNYSVVVFKDGNQYYSQLMDRQLANSLLIKLYYFKGAGLKLFKPFTMERDLTGRTEISVFGVEWQNF